MPKLLIFYFLFAALQAQTYRGLVDAHVHHNGDPAFVDQLVSRLEKVNGMAFLMVEPKDFDATQPLLVKYKDRLVGFGEIRLDDPNVMQWIDRFHNAGFRGLGEISGPLKDFHDKSYWPIYERAERYNMILLFHTGIVNRSNPEIPADISSERMRVTTLDNIARRFPKLTIIAAHLGNPDYAWAAELGRWNPNLYFDLSGSTLIKKQEDYRFFKTIFWWSAVASPHTPKSQASAFEKIVFGSDVFGGELEEFDRSVERYRKMLEACGVSPDAQRNIFGGTLRRVLHIP